MRGLLRVSRAVGACFLAYCLSAPGAFASTGSPAGSANAAVGESLGAHTARFFADESARKAALPSLALEKPVPGVGPIPTGFSVVPQFSAADGKQVARVPVEAGTSCYGTGEVAGPLLRNGRKVVAWNTDAYAYDDKSASLYKSHPWVLAVRENGSAFGLLADTTYRCEIDCSGVSAGGGEIVFRADGPAFAVIVIDAKSPQEVVIGLTNLTGKSQLPPRWALGYHQCRYSYNPDTRVIEIATEFRKRKIPCDVIWHDIDYMDGYRCFTWDKKQFPDPTAHNGKLHTLGFKTVWMIDPGIKAEKDYFVYDQGTANDVWVKSADGKTDYNGEVWPGMCAFPDYTMSKTREWWAGLYKDFMATGIDGVWNDMNEPAVFNTPDKSKTMPETNIHRGDADLGGTLPHAKYHNFYGTLMVKATRDGIMKANPDKRPFVLSRALHLGGQRYAASWTGDNSSNWYHLENSIPMVLNLGLSGQPLTGPDIGGFDGNGPKGEEGARMFARWMGIGALLPFSRGHTAKGNIDKEPWAFGVEAEKTCREAIERRYILMPYLYTLFQEASTVGLPVARPLFFADPADPALRSEDDAFLLGDSLMVVAQCVPDQSRAPALPRGDWKKLRLPNDTGNRELPDLYLKGGAIIPGGPVMQYTGEKATDPLSLFVSLDKDGKATGTLYEDAGEGWGYQRGEYLLTEYSAVRRGDSVTVSVAGQKGESKRPARGVSVSVLVGDTIVTGTGRDGEKLVIDLSKNAGQPVKK